MCWIISRNWSSVAFSSTFLGHKFSVMSSCRDKSTKRS
jgi:hypothetical protein